MATPLDILEENLNQTILVTLKTGTWIRGVLKSYDKYLNLVLEKGEEIISNSENEDINIRKLGDVIVRGDTVVSISAIEKKKG